MIQRGQVREEVEAEEARSGRMTMSEAIRHRVRYLTEGAVFGSERFVNRVFVRNRRLFGKTRQTGARAMREANWENLCVLRDLREEVLLPTRAT